MDLADHYWSMHVLVHGRSAAARTKPLTLLAAKARNDSRPVLQWAA
jgi:hypothetical protein